MPKADVDTVGKCLHNVVLVNCLIYCKTLICAMWFYGLASGEGIAVVGIRVCVSVCPPSRDCTLVSVAKVMRCIQCSIVFLFILSYLIFTLNLV